VRSPRILIPAKRSQIAKRRKGDGGDGDGGGGGGGGGGRD